MHPPLSAMDWRPVQGATCLWPRDSWDTVGCSTSATRTGTKWFGWVGGCVDGSTFLCEAWEKMTTTTNTANDIQLRWSLAWAKVFYSITLYVCLMLPKTNGGGWQLWRLSTNLTCLSPVNHERLISAACSSKCIVSALCQNIMWPLHVW